MKFPHTVRFRALTATIYGKSASYPFYRMAVRVAGKRVVRSFQTFTDAKREAEAKLRQTAAGSVAAGLSAKQSQDALTAFQRLTEFSQATGRKVSLLTAIAEFADASALLEGRSLPDVARIYLQSIAQVKRMDIAAAVEEFLAIREPKTKPKDGKRPELAPAYHFNICIILRRFAATFPNTAVCDLTQAHIEKFLGGLSELSAKTRNHYRATVKMFFAWCSRRDYLSRTHRLVEAEAMSHERSNTAEVGILTPDDFRKLLAATDGPLCALLAIGGLAGLRMAELLRLDWSDLWRASGFIEVTAANAKTRQRRLVPVCEALAAWLRPFANMKSGRIWGQSWQTFQRGLADAYETSGVKRSDNALRHSYVTYRLALTANENMVAMESGNTPGMIHAHYRALATPKTAEKWFAIVPPEAAANVIPMAAHASA